MINRVKAQRIYFKGKYILPSKSEHQFTNKKMVYCMCDESSNLSRIKFKLFQELLVW
jgi:hypothetical protein